MNEAVRPDVAERAAPAIPETPAPETMPRPAARPRSRRLFGRLALLAALAVAAFFAWEKFESTAPSKNEGVKSERPATPPQTVRVGPVTVGDMPITIDALGTVTPFETVTIRTQIAGKLMELGFTEGQMVKKGDFLAQIDPRPYEAALAQAQGQLAKDQALLLQALGNLSRYETLSKQDSISKQQVTDQEALVTQDKAAIASDQAQVQTAQINLDYTRIVSPITGRAGLRLVDTGNYLQPADATGIVVVTQLDPISVVFSTPEDNLPRIAGRLKSGAELKVTAFDRANVNALATGTLTAYDNQIDVTTGTIKMRATFDNAKGALFPLQFVNVRLLVDTMKDATVAPNAAIQIGPSGDFVYLLKDDGTVSKRDVVSGPTDGKVTTISEGLAPGDRIVIDGIDRLRDGAKVRLAENTPAGAVQGPGDQSQGARGGGFSGGGGGVEGGDAQVHRHRHSQGGRGGGGDSSPTTGRATTAPAQGATQ